AFVAAATYARGTPDTLDGAGELEIIRGVSHVSASEIAVTVRGTNPNPDRARYFADVAVSDTVPDGFSYKWGSVALVYGPTKVAIPVVGTNPYTFRVGHLRGGEGITFTYGAIKM